MNNYFISLIRTWVPIGVGWLLTLLAESTGFVIDGNTKASLVALCVAVLTALYYTLGRFLENLNPFFGYLLGYKMPPNYSVSHG